MSQTYVKNIEAGQWQTHPTSPGVFRKMVLPKAEKLGVETLHVKIMPGGEILPHTHTVAEVMYIISGTTAVLENGKRVDYEAGNLVIAPAGAEHSLRNNTTEEVHILANFAD